MARRSDSSSGWRMLFLLLAAAALVLALFFLYIYFFRAPVENQVGSLMATVTAAAPPKSAPATATSRPPTATATPAPGQPTATRTRRPTADPRASATPTLNARGATGENLRLFVEPDAGREPVLTALAEAKRSIDLVIYLLLDQPTVDALVAAQKRGVAVRVMLEPRPFGGGNSSKAAEQLRAAGVQVKDSNPTFRFTHQKTFIIDNRTALIMSLNLTASSFTRNREYAVIDTDPKRVAEILAVFNADWNRTKPNVTAPELVWSPDNSRQKLVALMKSARRTIELQTEVMADDEVIETLIDRARQGVKVRVIMSPPEDESSSDDGLDELTKGGVSVRVVRSPYIHAKLVLVDGNNGWIGSENFSANSLDNNRELGILMDDKPILDTLLSAFERDWAKGTPR